MKTPPSDLPPIPLNHVYIGVDDGSLIEEGCEGEKGLWTGNYLDRIWSEFEVKDGPPRRTGRQVLAPTGSRLHMLNSVPDGFDYYGRGPLKSISDTCDHDVALFTPSEGWTTRWSGVGGHHYALRSGSPIALANGLVPFAPAPMHQATTEDVQDSIRANFTKSAAVETPKTVSDLEKWCAEWRDNIHRVNVQQIDTLKKRAVDMVAMPVPATSESAAARMRLDAFAEQVKTLKADLAAAEARDTHRENYIQDQHIASWAKIQKALGDRGDDGTSLVGCAVAAIEERNELLEIRDMMTQQINSLRTELANLKAEIKNRGAGWDVAANLRDEVKRLKRAGDMAATSYNEARIERDDAVQELARVRETLRTFYAAAEAMKAEVAK